MVDLETGGLQAHPAIISGHQWRALEKRNRGPRPVFEVEIRGSEWAYCPGNPITQIAAAAVDAMTWETIDEFQVKLHFRTELATEEALEMNSYDVDTWQRDAVNYPQGLEEFRLFLNSHRTVELISKAGNPYMVAQLCGQDAASFDLEFLLRSFQDPRWQRFALPGDAPRTGPIEGMFFPGSFQVLDTLHLARWALAGQIEDFKLETLANHFGIPTPDAHDALADVRTTVEVARLLQRMIR